MYRLIKPALFLMDPEKSHNLALPLLELGYGNRLSRFMLKFVRNRTKVSSISCMGLNFPNHVGLAAGLDKNADYLNGLAALGFGFIEVGTVTPRAQDGNSKPRLFRLTGQNAIINRMGFNNKGIDYLVERVKRAKYQGILGINIGKNADTAIADANEDYLICLHKAYPVADYITVNISSPNTPGLRELQHGNMLTDLFDALKAEQSKLTLKHRRRVPIAVKIAPDMSEDQLDEFAERALSTTIDAVIATNTSFSRAGVEESPYANETGGLSGQPLTQLSTKTITQLGIRFADRIPIIGAGGIHDAQTANAKLSAGATLVQIYTGLIFKGPGLVNSILTSENN